MPTNDPPAARWRHKCFDCGNWFDAPRDTQTLCPDCGSINVKAVRESLPPKEPASATPTLTAYVDAKVREVLEEFGREACRAQCPACATGMNVFQGEEGQWWHARNGCTTLCAADPIRRLLAERGVGVKP